MMTTGFINVMIRGFENRSSCKLRFKQDFYWNLKIYLAFTYYDLGSYVQYGVHSNNVV